MKAIVYEEFGGPEVLTLTEVARPVPGPGQVRVRVHAAGVNPIDGKIRSGAMRQMFPVELPTVPGSDVAGVVDALGEGVTGARVGDAVLGWAESGSYAEFALVSAFIAKPAGLDWAVAAALPVAGETAARGLRELRVQAGETLLIHGAAGAVGGMAVQLAVARGLTVIGTASPDNQDYLAELGAIPTTYGPGLVDRVRALAPQGVDAVYDVAGKGALPDSITLRGGTDRIITIADPGAAGLGIPFSAGNAKARDLSGLAELAELVARGEVRATIAATFELAEAAAAARISDAGHVRGKLVLTLG